MDGILKVTPETLKSTAGEFQSTNGQLKSTTDEMVNLINGMKVIWEGTAAETFISKVRGLQPDMNKIHNMISEHVKDLTEMADTYMKAEQTNTQTGSALQAGILE